MEVLNLLEWLFFVIAGAIVFLYFMVMIFALRHSHVPKRRKSSINPKTSKTVVRIPESILIRYGWKDNVPFYKTYEVVYRVIGTRKKLKILISGPDLITVNRFFLEGKNRRRKNVETLTIEQVFSTDYY